MSNFDETSMSGEPPIRQSITHGPHQPSGALIPQVEPVVVPEGVYGSFSDSDPGRQSGLGNPAAYVHALRRRWLLAGFLGAACAVAAVAAIWLTKKPTYTASAMLQVSSEQKRLVFEVGDTATRNNFDTYKSTQQELVKSDYVLIAALRKQELKDLAVLQREADPIRYLAKELRVEFPGNSELMLVRLSGDDPSAVALIVNAVVEAYLTEIVDREKNARRQRLTELEELYVSKGEEMRKKRIQLKSTADQVGTSNSDALVLKQQIALEQFSLFRQELVRAQFETRKIQGELTVQQAVLQKLDELEKSGGPDIETDLKMAVRADLQSAELLTRQAELEAQITDHKRRAVGAISSPTLEGYERDLKQVSDQLTEREAELRVDLASRRRREIQSRVAELTSQLAVAIEQEKQLTADVDASRIQAEEFGGSSIDVEIMRWEIAQLESVLDPIAAEREQLRVEVDAQARVQLVQKASTPRVHDDDNLLSKLIMAAMAGFGLPFAGILFLDVRKRRVNTPVEVTRELGIQVLGTMPRIRGSVPARGSLRRNGRSEERVREAVNGIIARLLHELQHGSSHVVLVSSASGGEGKTTLSMQLATGLAHIGYRTLLIDFDLRRPSLARLFGLPSTPGVSELLRGEAKLEDTYQDTGIAGLTFLPAGKWIAQSMSVLANGSTRFFFSEVRSQFDFVIVDGSPVLPVAETRMIARQVDRVVLSVLRDVSRAPQVMAAWEMLTAFGAPSVEAVVTGYHEDVYYGPSEPVWEANSKIPSTKEVEVT